MDIKKELGKKIQLLRQDKGMSRQDLCQDEEILTTRQLQRIEKGENVPNATTALYLARQLGVTVDELLDEQVYFLPKDYLELKYQLFRDSHYGDEIKLEQRENILEEIYDTYFDNLPQEEQLSIQLFQAMLDIVMSNNPEFDQGLLEEHFPQLFTKKRLTVNDLLLIRLYFVKMSILKKFEQSNFRKITAIVKQAATYFSVDDLFLVQEHLLKLVFFYLFDKDYNEVTSLLQLAEKIMSKRHDFQDKPLVLMIYWKLALFEEKDVVKAEEFYKQALLLCEWTNQSILKSRLEMEWQADLKE